MYRRAAAGWLAVAAVLRWRRVLSLVGAMLWLCGCVLYNNMNHTQRGGKQGKRRKSLYCAAHSVRAKSEHPPNIAKTHTQKNTQHTRSLSDFRANNSPSSFPSTFAQDTHTFHYCIISALGVFNILHNACARLRLRELRGVLSRVLSRVSREASGRSAAHAVSILMNGPAERCPGAWVNRQFVVWWKIFV